MQCAGWGDGPSNNPTPCIPAPLRTMRFLGRWNDVGELFHALGPLGNITTNTFLWAAGRFDYSAPTMFAQAQVRSTQAQLLVCCARPWRPADTHPMGLLAGFPDALPRSNCTVVCWCSNVV